MISLQPYVRLFALPAARRSFVASALGRLPIGVTGLAILLLVQSGSGSFARGGTAAACYVTGLSLLAPALGRVVDRHGPHRVLLGCAVLFPAMLALLVLGSSRAELGWLAYLGAAGAGATFPPITVCMRTYFRQVLADDALLAAAYSAESVLIELIFILGPLIVALFVAAASPAMAVWFSAACGLAGTLVFLRSPALRSWRVEARTTRSLLGPLEDREFVRLVVVVLCFATAFGFLEIGLTAYAIERANAAFAGVLLGIMSAGSALGGLAYGSRPWHIPLARQFAAALALTAAGLAVLALRWDPWVLTGWSLVAGIAIAPALIIQSMLVAKTARPEHSTEAFTWTTSALLAGVGIGLAVGGMMLERLPSSATLAAGAAASLAAAAGARFLLRR
jgi:predicted MFS family arabinose efflux permease